MLATLRVKLKKDGNITEQSTSLFQGVMMENLHSETAQKLHMNDINPYSQYIGSDKEYMYWNINVLNKNAYEEIIKPLNNNLTDSIFLRNKQKKLEILEKNIRTISYNELETGSLFFNNTNNTISIHFITPTAFKSNGEYIFYPDIKLIFQSAINKFNAVNNNVQINPQEILNELIYCSKIVQYNIRSNYFHLERVKIPAFKGVIRIKIRGEKYIANMANLLLNFAEFSGIGIKNSIGMGAIRKG